MPVVPVAPTTARVAPAPAGGSATTAAEFATSALVRATTACQRRGRAQKKRARKVKDKMRQLCLEVSTTTPSGTGAAEVAPWPRLERAARTLGELALAKAQLAMSKAALPSAAPKSAGPSEIRESVRSLATASAADASHCSTDGRLPPGVEPRPPLSSSNVTGQPGTAANDDGIAATAKGCRREASFATGNAKKSRTGALIAEDATKEGSSSGDGEGGYSSSGADQLSSPAGQFPTHRKTRRGKRAGGAINRRRRAKEMSGSKRSAAAATAAAARAREGTVCSDTVTAAASDGAVVDIRDVPVLAEGDDGAVGEGRERHGEGDNLDSKAMSIAANVNTQSMSIATAAVADTATDAPPPPPQAQGEHNSHRETPKIKNGEEVEPQQHQQEQRRTAAAVGSYSVDIGRDEQEDGGVSAEGEAEGCGAVTDRGSQNCDVFDGDDRRRGGSATAAAAGVTAGDASGRSGPSLSSSPSSLLPSTSLLAQDVAALEGAAWRSLQDLHAMCPSPACYPASASASAMVAVPGCSQQPSPARSPSSGSNGSGAAGATEKAVSTADAPHHRLRRQVRARGVLDSLVAICAPFPWTPVDPPLGTISAAKEGRSLRGCAVASSGGAAVAATSSTNPAGAAAALPGDAGVDTGSASDQSGGCYPETQRAGSHNCEHERHQHQHHQGVSQAAMATLPRAWKGGRAAEENGRSVRAKKNDAGSGGDCGSGGREAMTESALAVLLAMLAEEPSNRAYVLKMDGGAPLVSRWWCLRSNATLFLSCHEVKEGWLLVGYPQQKELPGLGKS